MNYCPAEILCYIFAEACTDDGQTGCALSLVSRYIHAVSRKHVLQSVALYGSHQISAFAARLSAAPADERRVRNLYLTDRRRVWMEYRPGQVRAQWLQERIAEDFHLIDPSRTYSSESILRILEHVAPTLRIFTILLFDRYGEQAFTMSFTALRELTIYGSLLNHHGYPEFPHCPELRRLHLVQDLSVRRSITRAVSLVGPGLTHLRISRLAASGCWGAGNVVQGLDTLVQTASECADLEKQLPPGLKRVIIQMSQQELHDSDGVLNLLVSPAAHQLKDVAMRDQRKRIILLKPHLWNTADSLVVRDTDVEFYMSIKESWEQRIMRLEALWDVNQSDVLASYGYYAEEPNTQL